MDGGMVVVGGVVVAIPNEEGGVAIMLKKENEERGRGKKKGERERTMTIEVTAVVVCDSGRRRKGGTEAIRWK